MPVRKQVTKHILKALAEGLVPWRKSWLGHRNAGSATNILTKFSFRGINPLVLNLAGFQSKWWGAQRVWTAFGFQLKPHQRGTHVFHGEADNLRIQEVFNAGQVEGPGVERYRVRDQDELRLPDYVAAESIIAATGADIRHIPGNEAAYYRLPKDFIILPLKSQFEYGPGGLPSYYSTAFHELVHHSEHRLRWLADPHLPTKERYALGEMRSEIGSAYLAGEIGIPCTEHMTNHAKYVGIWMKVIHADPTVIFRVAAAASDAVNFILSFSRKQKALTHTA